MQCKLSTDQNVDLWFVADCKCAKLNFLTKGCSLPRTLMYIIQTQVFRIFSQASSDAPGPIHFSFLFFPILAILQAKNWNYPRNNWRHISSLLIWKNSCYLLLIGIIECPVFFQGWTEWPLKPFFQGYSTCRIAFLFMKQAVLLLSLRFGHLDHDGV